MPWSERHFIEGAAVLAYRPLRVRTPIDVAEDKFWDTTARQFAQIFDAHRV
jgi:hypothetical protein